MTLSEKRRPDASRTRTLTEPALLPQLLVLILVLVAVNTTAFGQACSCGGAPLMGSLELPATAAGRWQFGLTYEYHSIADVVAETEQLADQSRRRSIKSGLLEISYGLTRRVSATVLLSFLKQGRRTSSATGTGEALQTSGFGDGLFLLKYSLVPYSVFHKRQLTMGVGLKVPFGKSSLTANNLLVSADMQPGSGAFDGVVWGHFYQDLPNLARTGVQATASYRVTGNNDHFARTGDDYRFGNELILTVGASYQPLSKVGNTLTLRYRHIAADEFSGTPLSNSGGQWLNLVPGVNLNISNALSFRIAGQIPVYRKLEGTQLTTSYSMSAAVYFSPEPAKQQFPFIKGR